jgi:hypothetical protein
MSDPEPTVDFGYPTPAHGHIPAFHSIDEEAEFWDTHDVTDFLAESRPVHLTIGGELARRQETRLRQAGEGDASEPSM